MQVVIRSLTISILLTTKQLGPEATPRSRQPQRHEFKLFCRLHNSRLRGFTPPYR